MIKLFDLVNESTITGDTGNGGSKRITSISSKGLEDIKKFEGFRESVYYDKGKYAIGYGSQVDPAKYKGVVIDETQAETMLKNFLNKEVYPYIIEVDKLRDVPLNQNQFDSLCSLIYNVGWPKFRETKLRKHIINRNKEGIKKEWSDWENKDRRKKELAQYLGVSVDALISPPKPRETKSQAIKKITPPKK